MTETKIFSRRDFLKTAGVAVGSTFVAPSVDKLQAWLTTPESIEADSANKISFREDSIMLVNDKPVFPIGLYYLPGPESQYTWDKMRDAGLNTVCQTRLNRGALKEAENAGIYTMAFIPDMFPDLKNVSSADKNRLQMLVESKSFLGYFGLDEPSLGLDKDYHLKFLQELTDLDSNHPVLTVFAESAEPPDDKPINIKNNKTDYPGDPEDLVGLSDLTTVDAFHEWVMSKSRTRVFSYDFAPLEDVVTDNVGYLTTTERYVGNLRSGKLGSTPKAVWATLSAHSEIPRTLKSMRSQAVGAVASGATGITFWDWPYGCTPEYCSGYPGKGTGYSVNWENIASIGRELNSVNEGLVGKNIFLGFNESGNVAYKVTKAESGVRYIFSALNTNSSRTNLREKITSFSPNTTFLVVGENRSIKTDRNGDFEDNFDLFDAHIYVQLPSVL